MFGPFLLWHPVYYIDDEISVIIIIPLLYKYGLTVAGMKVDYYGYWFWV